MRLLFEPEQRAVSVGKRFQRTFFLILIIRFLFAQENEGYFKRSPPNQLLFIVFVNFKRSPKKIYPQAISEMMFNDVRIKPNFASI